MSDFSDSDNDDVNPRSQHFNQAADHVQAIHKTLAPDDLLTLYGLYKQATVGPCDASKPGIFSIQARAKWCAWNDLKDMPQPTAMQLYIQKVQELDTTWLPRLRDNKCKPAAEHMSWVVHSIPEKPVENLVDKAEHEKNAFDYVKELNLESLRKITVDEALLRELDEHGMGLLHWATDRNSIDILEYLLNIPGVDVNLRDADEQTALHYAASCGHVESVRVLLKAGADRTAKDADGQLSATVAENNEIYELLREIDPS